MTWKVGASKSLPIADTDRSWDGPAARRRMVNTGAGTAKRGHLIYDDEADPETQAAYKLPFADLISGDLKAIPSGLRAAASRLPQTDIPQSVKDEARNVLDAYFAKMETTRMTPLYRMWSSFMKIFRGEVARDIAMSQIGGQIFAALDTKNMETEDYNDWHFLQDLYVADSGGIYAITISGGKLYRWSTEVDAANGTVTLGEPEQVNPSFATTSRNRAIKVERRADGRFAAFTILSTALLNKSGEIDTRSMFDTFIKRFKGDGSEYINIYHLGRGATRIGELKAIFRDENVLVGYYVLDDNVVANAVGETLAADKEEYWGGSIEFMSDDDGQEVEVAPDVWVRIYEAGTLLGYSIAPCAHGAAWGTAHLQVRTMNDMSRKVVSELVGGDDAALKEVEAWLDSANVRTKEPGAITRTATTDKQVVEPGATTITVQPAKKVVKPVVKTPPVKARVEEEPPHEEEEVRRQEEGQVEAEPEGEYVEAALELTQEDKDLLVATVTNSDWAKNLSATYEEVRGRVENLEESVAVMQAQLAEEGYDPESAPVDEEDSPSQVDQLIDAVNQLTEQFAATSEQMAGMEEELTRLRAFYDAAQPQQRRIFEKSPKRTLKQIARRVEQEEGEEDGEERELIHPVQRHLAQPPKQVRWKDHGLWQSDRPRR